MAGELILIVEDTARSAKLLMDVLPFHGYRVVHAPDAEEALRICAGSVPDVVLMDIHLPGMSGIDAVRAMRAMPAMASTGFVGLRAAGVPRGLQSVKAWVVA